LFLEESYEDRSNVLYTLKDNDYDGYISLYRKYLEEADLTEIQFARKYFDGWEHWQMVANASWFKPYISRWREELELEVRSNALRSIVETAKDSSSRNAYEANKFLLQGHWKPGKGKSDVGRPSKDAIKAKAEELFNNQTETSQDLLRLKELN
jgi:hypothetical protein